jgi:uncharacterized membrane protein
MEIDRLFGLPAHPLLVHVPVVLVPLALAAAVIALWPRARRAAAIAAASLALVGGAGAVLAVGAGQELEHRVKETEQVEEHAEEGERVELPAVAFGLTALAGAIVVEAARRRSRQPAASEAVGTEPSSGRWLPAVVLTVSVLVGMAATYTVFAAGHSGAEATWHDTPAARDGDDGD